MAASKANPWLRSDEVRDWLASLPAADADRCDSCGHPEGPFVHYEGEGPNCRLCAVRKQAIDESERLTLTELFGSALEAIAGSTDGIITTSIGRAARDAGEQFLARRERS